MTDSAIGGASRPLADLKNGELGWVVAIEGGGCLAARLEAMGIRPGRLITRLAGGSRHGPVTVQVGSARVAMGQGMARRVQVQVDGAP